MGWFDDFNPVAAIASGIDSVASALGMSGAAHYQRKNQRAAAQLQHDENLFWAEYNQPSNVMARLRSAGLNPNLVYGNGADAQFSGSVSPSGSAPEFRGNPGTTYLAAANLAEQNKNLQADNEVKKQQAKKEQATAEGIELDNLRKRGQNPFQYGSYEAMEQRWKALNAKTEGEKLSSEIALNKLNAFGLEIKNRFENAASYIRLDQMSIDKSIAEINKSYLPAIMENQLKMGSAQIAQAYSTIAELGALTCMYNELSKKAKQETLTEAERTDLTKADKEIRERKADLSKLGLNPDDNSMLGGILNAIIGIYQHRANW